MKINSNHVFAVVIPCYNEAKRFPVSAFEKFISEYPEVNVYLINDGSKDETKELIEGLAIKFPKNVIAHNQEFNQGKAEAVRAGMLLASKKKSNEFIGFLDADFATKPEEWISMAEHLKQNSKFGAVVGSRIKRLGADIQRNDNRSFLSLIIKFIIKKILRTPFQDTQCGAKVFHASLIPSLFGQPFLTPWLFDVEIFLRLQKKFGRSSLHKGVLEYPLLHWSEVGDSKLKFSDSIKIPFDLLKLYYNYHIRKMFKTKSGYDFWDKKNNISPVGKTIKQIQSIFL